MGVGVVPVVGDDEQVRPGVTDLGDEGHAEVARRTAPGPQHREGRDGGDDDLRAPAAEAPPHRRHRGGRDDRLVGHPRADPLVVRPEADPVHDLAVVAGVGAARCEGPVLRQQVAVRVVGRGGDDVQLVTGGREAPCEPGPPVLRGPHLGGVVLREQEDPHGASREARQRAPPPTTAVVPR